MEFAETVRRRRMVRAYDPDRPVAPEAVDAVVDAMLRAPSAGHTQGTSVLVLNSPDDRETFWAITGGGAPSRWERGMRTAPVLLLVWTSEATYLERYAEPDKGWTDRDPARWSAPYWYVDAGMAAMAGLLAAVDRALGACFFGVPVTRIGPIRERFGVPGDQLSVGVLSLGHPMPSGIGGGSPSRRPARPRSERVRLSRWTNVPGI